MSEEPRQLAVRFTREEMKKLNKIRARYGVKSYADAVRVAINESVR